MPTFNNHRTPNRYTPNRRTRWHAERIVAELREDKAAPLERYRAFALTRAYLAEKSATHAGREATRRLGEALGYNPHKGGFLDKFERHRTEFNTLARPVPYAYLHAIGAERDELQACLEADRARYHHEREKPRFPTTAAVRYMPTVYATVCFPLGTTEDQALRILQHQQHARFMRFIVYEALLSICIPAGAESRPEYTWFPPRWSWQKNRLEASPRPGEFGVMRIG